MANKLTPTQLKELKDCFQHFDNDNSGTISSKELKKICESLGLKVNEKQVKDMMSMMDKDRSGSIDLAEFIQIMGEQFYRQPKRSELEAVFDHFDYDKSGFITEDELFGVMSCFKANISKTDVQKLMQIIDKDKDNRISKREFIEIVLK